MESGAIIVTGASSGLGRHITRRLVSDGFQVLAAARREQRLADLREELVGAQGDLELVVTDVTDNNSVRRMVERAKRRFGIVSALVNNAGMEIQGGIQDLDESQFEAMLRTNVVGPFLCIRETLPLLKESRGAIVNIGSTVVTRAPRHRFGYVASKGALEAMSRALAGDLGSDGVRVNVVRPGIIPSELRGSTEQEETVTLEEVALGLQALPELGKGGDVAGVVAFLVSEEAEWITGAVIDVDGGYALGMRR